ncbi:MAG TPA: phenylalanine--tRNA ligase subunit beta [Haliangium sp.]|nr:phenylalanine--tRNA ligase subunit beta [Haliangium sp.]
MRAVWSWLRELVEIDQDISAEEAARALTSTGFEVESVTSFGQDFRGVVVAEVVAKRKHPESDRLTLVDVIETPGGTATQVVCGANNVPEPGGRVLWAKPGSVLPGLGEIGTRKIKGIASPGMLCAEDELGLGEDHDGIIVLGAEDVLTGTGELLGDPHAIERLGLRDVVFEVGVHANRPDAMGHLGLARELIAIVGGRLRPSAESPESSATVIDRALSAGWLATAHIEDPQGCPRYTARVIDGLQVRPSPRWMQQRLRAVGVRPLSNLVDVTNYVMFELGQPLHAFDYAKLAGAGSHAIPHIQVRRARAGERITTLDGVERELDAADLVICDARGPVALAGVMGGAETEVGEQTTRVLLESASFEPGAVRRTARRLGLPTEGSARFGRGVDPNLADVASARASALLARLGGGRVAAGVVDAYVRRVEPVQVSLRASRASMLIGLEITRTQAAELLGRLGIESRPDPDDDDRLQVICPTHRPDLTREVDLIEDVLRVRGFHTVPATLPQGQVPLHRRPDPRPLLARRALVAAGMSEAITFGFTARARVESLGLPASDRRARPIAVRNPMSAEQAVMRTSLVPNLLAAVARNVSFGIADVALFEIGSVFLAREGAATPGDEAAPGGEGLPDEPIHVAGVMTGQRPGWLASGGEVDMFDLKGAVECLLEALVPGQVEAVRFEADASIPYLHPGVCARVILPDGTLVGHVGEVHPRTRRALDVALRCFAFDLALDAFPVPAARQMRPVSRFPAVTRDLSMLMSADVPAARVRALIDEAAEPLIEAVTVLEDYRDPEHVPAGKKGMLWSITYRSAEGTLTDAQVERAHEAIVTRLLEKLPAQRR